jgi:hypothetical protein
VKAYTVVRINRWNCNAEVRNRGLSELVGSIYDQFIIKDLPRIMDSAGIPRKYPDWISVANFEDTGERFGLRNSFHDGKTLHKLPEAELTLTAGQMATPNPSSICNAKKGSGLGASAKLNSLPGSARNHGNLQGATGFPFTEVRTKEEKAKFVQDLPKYRRKSGAPSAIDRISNAGKVHGVHFNSMASDWNAFVEKMLQEIRDQDPRAKFQPIYRKNINQLERHYRLLQRRANASSTMADASHSESSLTADLRNPVDPD